MQATWKWKLAQQLELRWWQRYLANKDVVSYLNWKQNYWQKLLHQLGNAVALKLKDKIAILDAGCGPAGIFMALGAHQVVAIDPLLEQYRKLPHFTPEQYAHVDFVATSIEQSNYANEFDVVFCMNAINHVADIQLAYQQLINALKPDGIIVVSIDAHRNNLLKSIFKALPGDVLHPHQYNLKEYEQFLTQNGISLLPSILIKRESIFDYYITYGIKKSN